MEVSWTPLHYLRLTQIDSLAICFYSFFNNFLDSMPVQFSIDLFDHHAEANPRQGTFLVDS